MKLYRLSLITALFYTVLAWGLLWLGTIYVALYWELRP